MFNYDATQVKISDGPRPVLLPEGKYLLRIIDTEDKTSPSGLRQVVVTFEVDEGPCKGRKIGRHHVTFLAPNSKGAWIAINFLKSIGQPHEKNILVDSFKWRGAKLWANVTQEAYNGWVNNKIKSVWPITPLQTQEQVPF